MIAHVWRTAPEGAKHGATVAEGLEQLAGAVASGPDDGSRPSEFRRAVEEAVRVVDEMATAGASLPGVEQWRRVRAVISGALPEPSAREQAATRARMAMTGAAADASQGVTGERLSAMREAVRDAAAAARRMSLAITASASIWRVENSPSWQGGRDDPESGGSDAEDRSEDSDGDVQRSAAQVSPEEGPTDEDEGGHVASAQWQQVAATAVQASGVDMDDGASGSGGDLATGGSRVRGDDDGDGDGDDDDGDEDDDSDDDGNDDDDSDDDDDIGMVRGDIDEADGETVDEVHIDPKWVRQHFGKQARKTIPRTGVRVFGAGDMMVTHALLVDDLRTTGLAEGAAVARAARKSRERIWELRVYGRRWACCSLLVCIDHTVRLYNPERDHTPSPDQRYALSTRCA